jgi:hypothetical protein
VVELPQNTFDIMWGGWVGKAAMVVKILFCSDQDGWLSRSYIHTGASGSKMAQAGVSGSR